MTGRKYSQIYKSRTDVNSQKQARILLTENSIDIFHTNFFQFNNV